MSLTLASAIAAAVRDAGGRALIVGGWVRDRLLRRPSKDIDLEVFGVPEERLAALLQRFGRVEAVGQSFPVYKVWKEGDGGEGEGGRGQGEGERGKGAGSRGKGKGGRGKGEGDRGMTSTLRFPAASPSPGQGTRGSGSLATRS